MKTSSDRILTSHAGSLPRPDDLIELNAARLAAGMPVDEQAFQDRLREAVADLVARQRDAGIDVPNDGEYGHAMGGKVNYDAWWTYMFERLGGLEISDVPDSELPVRRSEPGKLVVTNSFSDRRDKHLFPAAYTDPDGVMASMGQAPPALVCRAALTYTGQDAVRRDIANVKAAMAAAGVEEGFLNAVAPGTCADFQNVYYKDAEDLLWAVADAMREEYQAIVDAGLILQLDDPCIAENWDRILPEPAVEDYQRFARVRVEALNHAIRGLPEDRIRFHLCWGSWHGPHVTDIPMRDIVEVMLEVNAGAYLFDAATVRHEHEWNVWREAKLPDGKIIMPGVVSHATSVVEHPELVADRIVRFAEGVGRENVIAGTDCGLGGRVHPEIAWAKLESLVRGAELATSRLWD